MSAQLKSFEGPDVQLLLDGIRRELGPGAKIDRAERIRVGGILGFFAKEHYRVVVEVPEGVTAASSDTAAVDAGQSRRARRKNRPAPVTAPTMDGPVPPVTGDVFSAMAEATDDVTEIASVPTSAPAPPVIETPAPAAALIPEALIPEALTPAPTTDQAAVASVPESFDAVLTRVATSLGAVSGPGTTGTLPDRPAIIGSGPADPGDDPLDGDPADVASGAAMFLAGSGRPAAEPWRPVPKAVPAVPAVPADPADDATVVALRRVGLDASMIACVSEGLRRGAGLEALLLEVFAPHGDTPALPRQAGSLLVVVGEGVPARRLAAALAGDMGTDPAGVPFASLDTEAHRVATGSLLVRSAEDAAERAPGWRRSQAAVVVVDASVTGPDRSWATHLIAALRPTAVWGVVEATAKTEDIGAWMTDLGGVDALALEHLDATVSPAAVLSLGAPVARIDGQPATAARWVATVVDRINPCR